MSDSFASTGIDVPSPTLTARLRELSGFLAAPTAGRLTDEQRALSLGVARRLVFAVAAEVDDAIDAVMLWDDWLRAGLPHADALAAACFIRVEEHRWREGTARRAAQAATGEAVSEDEEALRPDDEGVALSPLGEAYLALQIADRRRFDAHGDPMLALADVDENLFRGLLHAAAAWRLEQLSRSKARAAELGDAVRIALERRAADTGMDAASRAYHTRAVANEALPETASAAALRHDWVALLALAAAAYRTSYHAMAAALLSAEAASLPALLAPLRLDSAALAAVEASLARLSARAIASEEAV